MSEINADYYEKNKDRLNGKRNERIAARTMKLMGVVKEKLPATYTLLEDATGQYKPMRTEFNRSEMRGMVEDAFAPEGSIWQGDDGKQFMVIGKQLKEQRMILLSESETV